MPSRNILKQRAADAYYHIYARGNSKQQIFLDEQDYGYFTRLFERYLSQTPKRDKSGVAYPHFATKIELLAFCLMSNHFHLLIWQADSDAITAFMRSIMTSYSRYFNLKYKRTGSLFESRYKAALIDRDEYLQHISRYIHLNPPYWRRYQYSSLRFYVDDTPCPEWLTPSKATTLFANKSEYLNFVGDYEEHKQMLEELKHQLANQ